MEAKGVAGEGAGISACRVEVLTIPDGTVKVLKKAGINEVGLLLVMTREELTAKGIPDEHLSLTAKALLELNLGFGAQAHLVKGAD